MPLIPISEVKPGDVVRSPGKTTFLEVEVIAATWLRVLNFHSGEAQMIPKACWSDGMVERVDPAKQTNSTEAPA